MKRFFGLCDLFMLISCLGMPGFSPAAFAGSGPTTLPSPVPSAFNYYYGISVAMTPDGSIAVVAANAGGYGLGTQPAVYVFQYANGAWNASPIITVHDPAAFAAPTDLFGSAVVVSGVDSNSRFILVVGSPGGGVVNGSAVSYGLVYIYQCTLGSTPGCTQLAEISDTAVTSTDQFGSAMAVSADGTILLVGAWGANEPGGNGINDDNEGAVYVYTSNGGTWNTSPRTTLLDPAPTCTTFGSPPYQQTACDKFGYTVALSGTGNSVAALIGAPGAVISKMGSPEPGEGAAFFFGSNSNGALQPLTQVIDPNTGVCTDPGSLMCDEFGRAVALSANGNVAAVGAPNTIAAVYGEAGAVSILGQASAGSWSGGAQLGCTYTNANPNMNTAYTGLGGFGWSLALSNDGSTLSVGMPEGAEGTDNGGYGGTGEIDVFDGLPQAQCSNTPTTVLVDPAVTQNPGSPSPEDFFGAAVALSGDSSVTLAGAPNTKGPAPDNSINNGLAYVYGAPTPPTPVGLSLSVNGPNNVSVSAGQDLTYTFTVTNTSNTESAVNVTLTGALAAGVTLVADTSGGATCSSGAGSYSCVLASLGPGVSWTPSVTLLIASSDAGQTVVAVSSSVTAGNSSSNPSATASVTVSQVATALSLYYQPLFSGLVGQLEGGCSTYNGQTFCTSETVCTNAPGSDCPMLIEVYNTSNTQPADNVGMIVTIPAGMTVSNVNAGQGSCFLYSGSGSGGSLWCGLGTLAPQNTWTVYFYYTINSTDANGQAEDSEATVGASNMPSVIQAYNFNVGTPTTVVSTNGGGAGSVGWLELAVLGGVAWLGRRRGRTPRGKKPGAYTHSHSIVVLITIISAAMLMLTGCAVTLKPSPSNGSGGLASPVTIGVRSNTEIVNNSYNGPATSISATMSGKSYSLNCNSSGSTCSLSQALATGAYTLKVTAPVAVPAFYSIGGNPTVSCNLTMGVYGQVNTCATLTATATFAVGCAAGLLTVTNAAMIPVPAGQAVSFQLVAQGGCPPYTWIVGNPGMLPPGISISASGIVSGTEATACTPDAWTIDNSIKVSDSLGDTGQAVMTFNIC